MSCSGGLSETRSLRCCRDRVCRAGGARGSSRDRTPPVRPSRNGSRRPKARSRRSKAAASGSSLAFQSSSPCGVDLRGSCELRPPLLRQPKPLLWPPRVGSTSADLTGAGAGLADAEAVVPGPGARAGLAGMGADLAGTGPGADLTGASAEADLARAGA